jgi:hypothetical protein
MVLRNIAVPLFAPYIQRLRYNHLPAGTLSELMALEMQIPEFGVFRRRLSSFFIM